MYVLIPYDGERVLAANQLYTDREAAVADANEIGAVVKPLDPSPPARYTELTRSQEGVGVTLYEEGDSTPAVLDETFWSWPEFLKTASPRATP